MSYIHWLVILSVLISIAGAYAYIRDTLAGRTQPNRVSWFLWALAPLIGTGAALSAQADPWVIIRIFLAGFLPLLVFIASLINKKSYWKITSFDIVCGAFSILALVAWLMFDSFQLAILLAVIADGFAALPTIRKSWRFPETETGLVYIAGFVSTILILPSIPVWNVENSAFQIYLLIVNLLLLSAVYRKRLFSKVFK